MPFSIAAQTVCSMVFSVFSNVACHAQFIKFNLAHDNVPAKQQQRVGASSVQMDNTGTCSWGSDVLALLGLNAAAQLQLKPWPVQVKCTVI